jgi:nitroreductase
MAKEERTRVDTLDAIRGRRTVRTFTDEAIDDHTLIHIVEAGRLAPSSRNRQPWRFVVVDRAEDRAALATVGKGGGSGTAHVASAPVTIALTGRDPGDDEMRMRLHYDLGQASMSMQLAAVVFKIGTCPAAVDDDRKAAEVLRLASGYVCPYLLTLGHPRDRVSARRVHDRLPFGEVARWLGSE